LLALWRNHDPVCNEIAESLREGGLKLIGSHWEKDNLHREFTGLQPSIGEEFKLL
jgi:hypothetical protein